MEGITKETFLSLSPEVDLVPLGYGMSIWVRSMSGLDREKFEHDCAELGESPERYSVRALLTIYCACDGNGTLLFERSDLEAVSQKPASILNAIYEAASRLNQLGAANISALAKNSETVTDDDSPTD